VQERIVARWGQAPFRGTASKRSPLIYLTHELVPDSESRLGGSLALPEKHANRIRSDSDTQPS